MKRVTSIEIDNFRGIEHLVLSPGALTVVTGTNGVGKSSVLKSVAAAVKGGHDPSFLRKGATEGRIRIVFEDATVILKRFWADKSLLDVSHPEMGKISRAQTWLDSQFDELAVNALDLVNCPASKCAEYIAEVMPVRVDSDELEPILGRTLTEKELDGNALDLIAGERQRLYDERTAVNRTAKEKRATVSQLRETLPPAEAVPEDVDALRSKKQAIGDEHTRGRQALRLELETLLSEFETETRSASDADKEAVTDEIEKVKAEAQRQIDELQEARRAREAHRQETLSEAKNKARGKHDAAVDELDERLNPSYTEAVEAVTRAEASQHEWQRASKTREIIASSEKDAARAEAESKALSHAIDELDALRTRLLGALPIKGLEIRKGETFVDGITWSAVNKRRRYDIALDIACLRAGDAGLVVLDDGEGIAPASLPDWEAVAAAKGRQVIVSRVTDGNLSVRTVEAAAS